MQSTTCQGQNVMFFEHDQEKDPEIIAYTSELFSMFRGFHADELLVDFMRLHAASLQRLINDSLLLDEDSGFFRSRRQWLLRLLSVADRSISHLRPFMARVIVEGHSTDVAGAVHGVEAERSASRRDPFQLSKVSYLFHGLRIGKPSIAWRLICAPCVSKSRTYLGDRGRFVALSLNGRARQAERRSDGAAHGGEAARSAGTATGAALAAHPHGNHGDNQQ